MAEQLLFDLPSRVAFERDAFLVAASNAEAVALIDSVADWAPPVQWIYGPAGCGKTHLAAVLAQETAPLRLTAQGLAQSRQLEALLQGQAEALTQTAATRALEGDSVALRLCMERIAPAPKDKSVSFPLPEMKDAMDASQAASSVLTAVSDGELTPIEGTRVMGLIDSYRRTLELTEIEERLQALENAY